MTRPSLRQISDDLRNLVKVYRGRPLPRASGDELVRVAVVLGAQVLPGGRPSRTLAARVEHAARLYAERRIDTLIPTGGLGEHPPSEAEVMAGILYNRGVPQESVLLEDRALNTWDSARRVAEMARELGVERVLVVTDPLHCARTVAAFREAGLMALPEPVYGSPMWRGRWSRRGQLVREIGALIWYRTRHGIGARSLP